MAFPYIFEANFEGGTNSEFDSETDTGSLLNIVHYTKLSGYDASIVGPIAPFRGAYVAEWNLGDTNDHTFIEGDFDIADGSTAYTRFHLFLGKNLTATADDTFPIYELQGTANAVESCVGLKITAATNAIQIGVGSTVPSSFATQPLTRGRWYTVELLTTDSTAAVGVSTLFVNGEQMATVTTVTNTAILRAAIGTQDTLSTTTGYLFMNDIVFDDLRLYPFKQRRPVSQMLTKSAHVFVGPGWIEGAAIQSSTGAVTLYDTDTANVDNSTNVVALDMARGISGYDGGAYFSRGCYAVLSTSSTLAEVKITDTSIDRRRFGPPAYMSNGALRQYGYRRKARHSNV